MIVKVMREFYVKDFMEMVLNAVMCNWCLLCSFVVFGGFVQRFGLCTDG